MGDLNLPDEFRETEEKANRAGEKGLHVVFSGFIVKELLEALSDARDLLHEKDCTIGDLVREKKDARDEIADLDELRKTYLVVIKELGQELDTLKARKG